MPTPPRRATHHQTILETLRERITGGDWPPGHPLPPETRLAELHGVSRMTMNKVLAQLAREGFILRRRKLGSFVARPVGQAAVMEIADIQSEVAALGLEWRFDLHERRLRPPTADEAARAGIPAGDDPVLALEGVHHAGDQRFCHERRIISLAAAPAAAEADFGHCAPGRWLLSEVPWTSAEHRIRAVAAASRVARALGVATGTACLEVTRRTEAAGQWVTAAVLTYPGDRHELIAQFGPNDRRPGAG